MHSSRNRGFSFSNHPNPADGSWNQNNNSNSNHGNTNRWQQQQQQQQESQVAAAGRQPLHNHNHHNDPMMDPHALSASASFSNHHRISANNNSNTAHHHHLTEDSQVFVWTRLASPTTSNTATSSASTSSSSSTLSHIPPPRSGAASVVLDNRLYIFGGYGGGTGRLDDFYAYDFTRRCWQLAPVHPQSPRPGCRENNGVVIADETSRSIYLFGGYNGQAWLNDLWKYSVDTQRWTCLQESTPETTSSAANDTNNDHIMMDDTNDAAAAGRDPYPAASSSSPTAIRGQPPSRRFGFVSVVHDGRFIVFGGFDGSRWLNDMYCFTFATSTWTQIEQPHPSNTTTNNTTDQHATNNNNNNSSATGRTSNNRVCWPSARSCPAWAKDDRYVYIQGGYDGLERKSDFFALDLATYTWREMPSWGSPPSPRYFHSCGLYGNKLVSGVEWSEMK